MKFQHTTKQPRPLKSIMGSTLARAVAAILLAVTIVEIGYFSYTLFLAKKRNQDIISEVAFSAIQEPIEQGAFVEANRRMTEMIRKGYFACAKLSAWDFEVDHCTHVKLHYPAVVHREIGLGQGTAKAGDLVIYFDQQEFISSIMFRLIFDALIIAVIGIGLMLFFNHNARKIYAQLDKIVTNATRPFSDDRESPSLTEKFDILEFDIVSREIASKLQENLELSKSAAIAQMTQMLAHDVRRPFSMLKMLLDLLLKAKSPDQIKMFAEQGIPDTIRAMNSVNGLIQDVMEISSTSGIFPTEVKPESIIETALDEVFQSFPEANISINYSLSHRQYVNVEARKVLRVFANILANAVQSLRKNGNIWIQTKDVLESGRPFVEFILGNSGPHIPEEHLSKLFEAFFTSGKRGGTGLGLAIAHKIVTAHQGKIWCESSHGNGVEFHFTLPAGSASLRPDDSNLPKSSKDTLRKFQSFASAESEDNREAQLEQSLKNLLPILGRKLSILIVDDEGVYRDSLAESLTRDQTLASFLVISRAKDSQSAAESYECDLAIVDVDLGVESLSGFEIVREMRKEGTTGFICIHSNRISASDNKTAIECGADAFLPKPMSRAHLLKLLIQSLERLGIIDPVLSSSRSANGYVLSLSESLTKDTASKTVFAFVDDMKTARMAWQAEWPVGTLKTFESPEDFWAHVHANSVFLEELAGVITDMNFGGVSAIDGREFAQQIRERARMDLPILVASNSDLHIEDFSGTVDGILGKLPPSKEIIEAFLKKNN